MGEGAQRKIRHDTAMVNHLLELRDSLHAVARAQICFAADIYRVQGSVRRPLYGLPKFVFGSRTQQFDCFLRVAAINRNGSTDGWEPVSLNHRVAVEFRSDFVGQSRGLYCVAAACKG